MSIKNDIEMVKEQLTSEEKFFEKSVITERFIKKYKTLIIGGIVSIVVLVGANIAYEINKESTAVAANETLTELYADTTNVNALERLKSLSPSLHSAFVYSQAAANNDVESMKALKTSTDLTVSDLAKYESAKTTKELTTYALSQDAIYKDLAQVQSAIILLKAGDTEKAHEKLLLISDSSSMNKIAKTLLHYGVK